MTASRIRDLKTYVTRPRRLSNTSKQAKWKISVYTRQAKQNLNISQDSNAYNFCYKLKFS